MEQEIKLIVDTIKINVEVPTEMVIEISIDDNPLAVQVTMDEKSKEYIANFIREYGVACYQNGVDHAAHILSY